MPIQREIKEKHLLYFNEKFNLFTFPWKMPVSREIPFSMPLGTHSGHYPLLVTLSRTQHRTEIEKIKVPQKLWRNLAEWKYLHISAGPNIRVWEYVHEWIGISLAHNGGPLKLSLVSFRLWVHWNPRCSAGLPSCWQTLKVFVNLLALANS